MHFPISFGLVLGGNTRVLSQEAKVTTKELCDALTKAAEIEVELVNAQQRYEDMLSVRPAQNLPWR